MNKILALLALSMSSVALWAQTDAAQKEDIPAIRPSDQLERIYHINNKYKDVYITVNAPLEMDPKKKTKMILYALPNGNSIEWTAGKKYNEGDDFHFRVQHIAAQTRFLRAENPEYNYVTVYLMARQKSWGTWRRVNKDISAEVLPAIIEDMANLYKPYNPSLSLSSHSGGGYFIFEYIRVVDKINPVIERLSFLDSTYGYEEEDYKEKLTTWLKNKRHYLNVTSYEDSTVIYNGKPLVSPQGGTWWRSKKMQADLAQTFEFEKKEDDTFLNFYANDAQITFTLIKNPEGKIWHTVLVEKNGLIDSMLSGTPKMGQGYEFWGERAYDKYVKDEIMR